MTKLGLILRELYRLFPDEGVGRPGASVRR